MKALVDWLCFSGFAEMRTCEEEEGWRTYVMAPGPYAHNLFRAGEASNDIAPFRAMRVGSGERPKTLQWGKDALSTMAFIRIEDTTFPELGELLTKQLITIIALRCETFSLNAS